VLAEITAGRDISRTQAFGEERFALSSGVDQDGPFSQETQLLIDPRLREYVTAVRGGAQWIYRAESLSAVSGFQILGERPSRTERSVVVDDALGEFTDQGVEFLSSQRSRIGGSDFYLYPTLHLGRSVDLTAGIVRTDVKREEVEVPPFVAQTDSEGRWNPKVGLVVEPATNFTVRGAWFESLRKSSLEDQVSIEPTLVGGITQRFNDLSGTSSRNLGFGADYKFDTGTYLGGEYIRRNLGEPGALATAELKSAAIDAELTSDATLTERFVNHVEQDFARGYLYQVLSPTLVASFDYLYGTDEVTDRDAGSDFLLHKVAAQLKHFHSTGLFSFARATWRKQQGINVAELADGKAVAWAFDAGVGYRMPNRRGTVSLEFFNLGDKVFAFDQSRGFEDGISDKFAVRVVAAVNF
jgi:hypothetical protein